MNHTKHFDYARLLSILPTLPVVLGVSVVGDLGVVHQIEDTAQAYGHLKQGGQPAVLGQGVLVVPAPVCPGHGTSIRNWVVELLAQQPGWELVDLHLEEEGN